MTPISQETIVDKSDDKTLERIRKNNFKGSGARRAAEQLTDADLKVKTKGHKPYLRNFIYKGVVLLSGMQSYKR